MSAGHAAAAHFAERVQFVDEDDAGRALQACWNISRTRAAPTPTNISTKSDPDRLKNGTPASPATALASSVLPVPGGPTKQHAARNPAAERLILSGRAEELDDFAEFFDRFVDAGDVVERNVDIFLGVEFAPAASERHRRAGSPHPAEQKDEEDQQHDRQDEQGSQILPFGSGGLVPDDNPLFVHQFGEFGFGWIVNADDGHPIIMRRPLAGTCQRGCGFCRLVLKRDESQTDRHLEHIGGVKAGHVAPQSELEFADGEFLSPVRLGEKGEQNSADDQGCQHVPEQVAGRAFLRAAGVAGALAGGLFVVGNLWGRAIGLGHAGVNRFRPLCRPEERAIVIMDDGAVNPL